MTGSTLRFNCSDCAKNRAGLEGGLRNWSGPKADERKAWSDQGVGIPEKTFTFSEDICSP